MNVNYDKVNKIQDSIEGSKNCSRCNQSFVEELWCKKCDPCRRIEGWITVNSEIDKFIKDTIYNANYNFAYKVRGPIGIT